MHSESETFQSCSFAVVIFEGWVSFYSWEDNPLINGNPKVVCLTFTFLKVKLCTAPYLATSHVQGSVSFHSSMGNPLINANPKVVLFNTHISESEIFSVV